LTQQEIEGVTIWKYSNEGVQTFMVKPKSVSEKAVFAWRDDMRS